MSMFAKYLIGLALALPMGAYVAGSLVSSASGEPERRDPVIIQDAEPVPPAPSPAVPPPAPAEGAGGDDVDDNGIRVVTPDPARVDDRDDDDDQDDGIGGGDDDDADDGGDDTTDD